jgi:hypothetical protein
MKKTCVVCIIIECHHVVLAEVAETRRPDYANP